MRWLFVTTPGAGHVQPLLGLALAARERGHAVAWATGADGLAAPMSHGIEGLPCGIGWAESLERLQLQYLDVVALPGRKHAPLGFPALFGRICAAAMLPALRAAAERWQPDLIVSEPAALAAPLVARVLGVPQLTHEFGLAIPPHIAGAAANAMAAAWRAAGLQVPPDAGIYAQAVIEIAPPGLRKAHGLAGQAPLAFACSAAGRAGLAGTALPAALQAFLDAQGGRPIVALSFGTLHRGGAAFDSAIEAAASLRVATVVLLGPHAPAPSRLPPHLHVDRFVHYPLLLPSCSAMVSHGGAGTMLAALAHGLPQLLLPFGADQFRNADAAIACGVARCIEDNCAPARLRDAIAQLLGDSSIRRRAVALRAEIDAMPSTAACVAQVEQALISGHFRSDPDPSTGH